MHLEREIVFAIAHWCRILLIASWRPQVSITVLIQCSGHHIAVLVYFDCLMWIFFLFNLLDDSSRCLLGCDDFALVAACHARAWLANELLRTDISALNLQDEPIFCRVALCILLARSSSS